MKNAKLFLIGTLAAICCLACKKDEDDPNNPPVLYDQTFSVNENAESGALVGTIKWEDEGALNLQITAGLVNDEFTIDDLGVIKVASNAKLNYEEKMEYALTVEAIDDLQQKAIATINVKINDVEEVSADSLILHLAFDESLNDASASENHGIKQTDAVFENGVFGKALVFNGTDDHVELTNTLNGSKGFSFSIWMKSKGIAEGQRNGSIFSKYDAYDSRRCFVFGTWADHLLFSASFFRTNTEFDQIRSDWTENAEIVESMDTLKYTFHNAVVLEQEQWTHCLLNMDGSIMELWIDGQIISSYALDNPTYLNWESEKTYIGNAFNAGQGNNNHFYGSLDDLRVYNRKLGEQEIEELYVQGKRNLQ